MNENSQIVAIQSEVSRELANTEVQNALLATTFKKLNVDQMKMAITEGMIRGFYFKDFLEKNVYAVPFGGGYSLVTSIDFARKRGMKSGIVGKDAPKFTTKIVDGKERIESCTMTVKKATNGYIGEFTDTVYFDEYYRAGNTYNGKYIPSLWDTKPRTMISKVAEMHALRMACPEELAQAYVEEEFQKEDYVIPAPPKEPKDAKSRMAFALRALDYNVTGKPAEETRAKILALTGMELTEENAEEIIEKLKMVKEDYDDAKRQDAEVAANEQQA